SAASREDADQPERVGKDERAQIDVLLGRRRKANRDAREVGVTAKAAADEIQEGDQRGEREKRDRDVMAEGAGVVAEGRREGHERLIEQRFASPDQRA